MVNKQSNGPSIENMVACVHQESEKLYRQVGNSIEKLQRECVEKRKKKTRHISGYHTLVIWPYALNFKANRIWAITEMITMGFGEKNGGFFFWYLALVFKSTFRLI